MAERRWAARAGVLLALATLALACAVEGGHTFFDDRFLRPADLLQPSDVPDADAPDVDAGPVVCTDRAGNICPGGLACPAVNGCNWCDCTERNRDLASCTLLPCADTGPPTCAQAENCAGQCAFFQGCAGTEGRCLSGHVPVGVEFTLCGCDGMTFSSGQVPLRPYAHAGPCP